MSATVAAPVARAWVLPLRAYQDEALEAWAAFVAGGGRRGIVHLPTGCGKTILGLAQANRAGRTLWLAHREELVTQPLEKARDAWPGGGFGIVRGSEDHYNARDLVVASVQTVGRAEAGELARLRQVIAAGPLSLVVVDEAHHALPDNSYGRILEAIGPDVPVLGLTATVERGDGLALGTLWEKIVHSYQVADAIRDGALAPPRLPWIVDVLSGLKLTPEEQEKAKSDADAEKILRERVEAHVAEIGLHTAARTIERLPERRRVLAFTVLVSQAKATAEAFTALGWPAAVVAGETPRKERRRLLEAFAAGELRVLCSPNALCLDTETEILTDRGWTGVDEMTFEHKVANFDKDTGDVFFEPPREIVRRPRGPTERMVSLDSPRRSIRVTEGHRMLYRTFREGGWLKAAARDVAGRCVQVPVSTVATPLVIEPDQDEALSRRRLRRLVTASAYNLRKLEGYEWDDSRTEAERRTARKHGLRRKAPAELSLDECRFVGFWIGDGSRCELQSGGVEYTLCQGVAWPKIVEWVDGVLARCGIHHLKRPNPAGNAFTWHLPRGTGSGSQEREGVFSLEPYLDKNVSDLLWGLNEAQFDALLEGLWLADGNHGYEGSGHPRFGHQIFSVDGEALGRLQALAVLRGYRASLRRRDRIERGRPRSLFELSYSKQAAQVLAGSRLEVEALWTPERVWCVRTTTSNLITRRRGTVTFMGNTEGFDSPGVDAVVLARPFVSKTLFVQALGRATRPSPGTGKRDWTVLDLSGCTALHDFFHSAPLLEGDEGEAEEKEPSEGGGGAAGITPAFKDKNREPPPSVNWVRAGLRGFTAPAGKGASVLVALDPAANRWTVSLERGRKPEAVGAYRDRELALGVGADAVRRLGGLRYGGEREAEGWRRRRVSESQLHVLERMKIPTAGVRTAGDASDLISAAGAKRKLDRRAGKAKK